MHVAEDDLRRVESHRAVIPGSPLRAIEFFRFHEREVVSGSDKRAIVIHVITRQPFDSRLPI